MRPPIPDLVRFIHPYDPKVAELFWATRELVLRTAPTANELIYDGFNAVSCAYSFSERQKEAFCHVAVYRSHVNLGINRGSEIDGFDHVLNGSGSLIRHIRIASPCDLERADVFRVLMCAVDQGEAMAPSKDAPGNSTVRAVYEKKRPRS